MKTPIMMLTLLALLGCAIKDDLPALSAQAETEGRDSKIRAPRTSDKTAEQASQVREDVAQSIVETTGPLWTIRSEHSVAPSKDASEKFRKKTGKPQGPLAVRYVLESWALDDHRLVIEVQSNREISDWQVDLPQLVEKQELLTRPAKPKAAEQGVPVVRTFRFGALPVSDRLLLTVNAKISGTAVSKTVSVPLRSEQKPSIKTCDTAQVLTNCVVVLPGTMVND